MCEGPGSSVESLFSVGGSGWWRLLVKPEGSGKVGVGDSEGGSSLERSHFTVGDSGLW